MLDRGPGTNIGGNTGHVTVVMPGPPTGMVRAGYTGTEPGGSPEVPVDLPTEILETHQIIKVELNLINESFEFGPTMILDYCRALVGHIGSGKDVSPCIGEMSHETC
ncbi:MAG: hypothetical protein V1897_09220 [Pseudomonadota bacterium]